MTLEDTRAYCSEIHELIPAYCLGATDPDETELVAAHLAACQEAAAEAADYRILSETLLHSSPVVDPPARLADRLFAATSTLANSAPQPATAPIVQPKERDTGPSLWQRLRAVLAGPGLRPLPVLAAIALVALLAVNVYLVNQIGALRSSVDDMQNRLGQQTAVLTQVGEGTYLRVALPPGPAGVATAAYGAIVCNPEEPQGFLLAENMPPLAPDQTYQIWLGQGDTLISAGAFQSDDAGFGKLVFTAPLPMGQYNSVQVTAEPAAGSLQPTSQPTIGGSLYGTVYPS